MGEDKPRHIRDMIADNTAQCVAAGKTYTPTPTEERLLNAASDYEKKNKNYRELGSGSVYVATPDEMMAIGLTSWTSQEIQQHRHEQMVAAAKAAGLPPMFGSYFADGKDKIGAESHVVPNSVNVATFRGLVEEKVNLENGKELTMVSPSGFIPLPHLPVSMMPTSMKFEVGTDCSASPENGLSKTINATKGQGAGGRE